jgi:hypothetical protein
MSRGFNLIGNNQGTLCSGFGADDQVGTPAQPINPGLGPLFRNIGPDGLPGVTETHLLFVGSSPAVDAGNPATPGSVANACERTDQRGFNRPQDGDQDGMSICDIGAVEIRPGGG